MRKLITIITVIAAIVFTNTAAHAEIVVTKQSYEEVQRYAKKSIPDVTANEVKACYDAVKGSGTQYTIERKRIKITCDEEEMVVFRRLF